MSQREYLLDHVSTTIRQLLWQGNKHGIISFVRIDLTFPQAMVLLGIESSGNQATMSDLAHFSQLSAGTLTGIVDRLIEAGLVSRERDEADRRVVLVRLTEQGHTKIAQMCEQRRQDMEVLTRSFSDAELATFTNLLDRLLTAMQIQGNLDA